MREEFFNQVCEILGHKFLALPIKGRNVLGPRNNDFQHGNIFVLGMPISCTKQQESDLLKAKEWPPMVSCEVEGEERKNFALEEVAFQEQPMRFNAFVYMEFDEMRYLHPKCDYRNLIQSCAREMYSSIAHKVKSKMPKKQAMLHGDEIAEEKFLEFLQSFDAIECSFRGTGPIDIALPGYNPEIPCESGSVKPLRLSTKTPDERKVRQKLLSISKGNKRNRNRDGVGK